MAPSHSDREAQNHPTHHPNMSKNRHGIKQGLSVPSTQETRQSHFSSALQVIGMSISSCRESHFMRGNGAVLRKSDLRLEVP